MHAIALAVALQASAPVQAALPVLSFPEPGLDDSAAYRGYRTRFYRDAADNVVQIYIRGTSGRVVHFWADAANESIGFTARTLDGAPVAPEWAADEASSSESGDERSFTYSLALPAGTVELGWFVLGSMRIERDFQYQELHLQPYGPSHFQTSEFATLAEDVARLPPDERARHLRLLNARDVDALRARLEPAVRLVDPGNVAIEQTSLDGEHRLRLELAVDAAAATLEVTGATVRVVPRDGVESVAVRVTIATDAPALTPLAREDIFNDRFNAFFERARAAHDSALAAGAPPEDPRILRFRWMDRQVKGVELVSSREKLMAGLPNFATYFGRDDILSALLMEPVWTGEMHEAVIRAVLGKLSPNGEVSHEESVGGQAIREAAAEYHQLIVRADSLRQAGNASAAGNTLERARDVLASLDETRENYRMVDDEFQLPVLVARYLDHPDVSATRKRNFLLQRLDNSGRIIDALLRELALVATMTADYTTRPDATRLISFPRLPDGSWMSASWRDSGAGYAGGRFAMDVNAIWVPEALRSIRTILDAIGDLGLATEVLRNASAAVRASPLARFLDDPASVNYAIDRWSAAIEHFDVQLSAEEARTRALARIAALPAPERSYWERIVSARPPPADGVRFTALSLDSAGRPIPVVNTDPAMQLLLGDVAGAIERGDRTTDAVLRDLRAILLHYPFGLFVEGLGPVVANDAYATPDVWQTWERDHYHSPRVVWGREVNVLLAGLARQIRGAEQRPCQPRSPALEEFVKEARAALDRIRNAVEASGLKHHELWSYTIENGELRPVRFETSTDVQLWNLTDLAVQFQLDQLRCTG